MPSVAHVPRSGSRHGGGSTFRPLREHSTGGPTPSGVAGLSGKAGSRSVGAAGPAPACRRRRTCAVEGRCAPRPPPGAPSQAARRRRAGPGANGAQGRRALHGTVPMSRLPPTAPGPSPPMRGRRAGQGHGVARATRTSLRIRSPQTLQRGPPSVPRRAPARVAAPGPGCRPLPYPTRDPSRPRSALDSGRQGGHGLKLHAPFKARHLQPEPDPRE